MSQWQRNSSGLTHETVKAHLHPPQAWPLASGKFIPASTDFGLDLDRRHPGVADRSLLPTDVVSRALNSRQTGKARFESLHGRIVITDRRKLSGIGAPPTGVASICVAGR